MYTAAVLHKPRQIIIETRAEAQLECNEVLIKVNYAGVCGTDIAIFSGEYTVPLPLVPGHEFTGEVSAVGSEVSSALIGNRVTTEINNTCVAYKRRELCPACRRNLPTHCTNRTVVGIISHDGAFAQLIKVPVGNIHELPENISIQEGVFIEPLAAAIQTFELAEIKDRDTVVVLGVGRLGILVCAVSILMGARTIAVSQSADKLRIAQKYGVAETTNVSNNDVIQQVKMLTDGLGADVVVECTGSPMGINTAINLVRPRGTVALKTTCGIPASDIDTTKLVVDEIRIQGSRCGPFDKAIDLLQTSKVSVASLIEDIYPLQDVAQAIESAKQASKILIHVN